MTQRIRLVKPRPSVSARPEATEATEPQDRQDTIHEWLVPAADAQGHSARIIARVPVNMKRQIARYIQQGKYPWATESDLVRWCLYAGLERLSAREEDPTLRSLQAILGAMVSACQVQQEHMAFGDVITQVEATVTSLISQGAQPAAKRLLAAVRKRVVEIEDSHWRKRYLRQIESKFGHLL